MSAFVIDTNVPIVANGKNTHADPACIIACIDALSAIYSVGMVVIDDGMRILDEYMRYLSMGGEPGAGDVFMKWVWSIQADESQCERVPLTQRHHGSAEDFIEFPDDPELAAFDPSDRKFVAVALSSENAPTVLNAVDSDWAEYHRALSNNGVTIRFLCPQHVCPKPRAGST
jgi:hypothetical protein